MVSTAPINRPLTVDDIADLPDGMRYELIWGELYVSLAPGLRIKSHQETFPGYSRSYLVGGGLGFLLTAPLVFNSMKTTWSSPTCLWWRRRTRWQCRG